MVIFTTQAKTFEVEQFKTNTTAIIMQTNEKIMHQMNIFSINHQEEKKAYKDKINQLQLELASTDHTTAAHMTSIDVKPASPSSVNYNSYATIYQENIYQHDNRQCCGWICKLFCFFKCCKQCKQPCKNMKIQGCSLCQ